MSFSAEIITDSKNEFGNRLTTVKATFPRYLLAEFNTHKMISKNSASSRAIPGKKLRESTQKHPYFPEKWMLDHPGMQGNTYLEKDTDIDIARGYWNSALFHALDVSELLNKKGELNISKQVANRLLEPFMYHTALMSATEWENFFALRAEGAAEINFQKSAFMILDAMNASEPKLLKGGEWHLPYADDLAFEANKLGKDSNEVKINIRKISTARCAGVSYVVVGEDGKEESYEKLIHRHDERLVKPGHWSPMEHPAKAMNEEEYHEFTHTFILCGKQFDWYMANTDRDTFRYSYSGHKGAGRITEYGWCGNYRGFIQYRKMFNNENRRDSRLIKK